MIDGIRCDFLWKTKHGNDMNDRIGAVYAKNDIELS